MKLLAKKTAHGNNYAIYHTSSRWGGTMYHIEWVKIGEPNTPDTRTCKSVQRKKEAMRVFEEITAE